MLRTSTATKIALLSGKSRNCRTSCRSTRQRRGWTRRLPTLSTACTHTVPPSLLVANALHESATGYPGAVSADWQRHQRLIHGERRGWLSHRSGPPATGHELPAVPS